MALKLLPLLLIVISVWSGPESATTSPAPSFAHGTNTLMLISALRFVATSAVSCTEKNASIATTVPTPVTFFIVTSRSGGRHAAPGRVRTCRRTIAERAVPAQQQKQTSPLDSSAPRDDTWDYSMRTSI